MGAAAGAAPVVPDAPWTLRADLVLNTPTDPLPGDAALTGSLKRAFGRHLFLEGTLGPGLPVSTAKRVANGTTETVDLWSGLHGAAIAGVQHKLTSSGRTLISLAAGPSFVSGHVFGTVPMVRGEGAFAWRFNPHAVASLSMGYESALKTSRAPFTAAQCVTTAGCPPRYESGKGQVSARWGLGFTF
jgi:hypothetical protein